MIEKLGLGTVQFGQAYGVSNQRGQVSREEARLILDTAARTGVHLLDTAANYGEAEDVLASLDTARFRVVTKTINLSHGLDRVIARARLSAVSLKADTILVHAASDLKTPDGEALWAALHKLKDDGIYRRIGVSAYAADDPVALANHFRPDVMQLPFSLLDQRLLADGTLARLQDLHVEIHARSLFLQGLLFVENPPPKLHKAKAHLNNIRNTLRHAGVSPLAAALSFVLTKPYIAFGIVGVTSNDELQEIITAVRVPPPQLDWTDFALSDELVLTPSLW